MKIGDLVKFTDRYKNQKDRMFLVIGRRLIRRKDESDDSIWAEWNIIESTTGSIYTQIGRDLEVISESQ